jgi:uncharacterized membrane protein
MDDDRQHLLSRLERIGFGLCFAAVTLGLCSFGIDTLWLAATAGMPLRRSAALILLLPLTGCVLGYIAWRLLTGRPSPRGNLLPVGGYATMLVVLLVASGMMITKATWESSPLLIRVLELIALVCGAMLVARLRVKRRDKDRSAFKDPAHHRPEDDA